MKIAIIGLGYVGLPLSLQFARSEVAVLGLDVDEIKVNSINVGESYIKHVSSQDLLAQVKAGNLEATMDFSRVKDMDAILICVPTPLNKNREPDLSYVLDTGSAIASFMKKGVIVVLESTTYPGTTDTDLRKILDHGSGMKAGVDYYLAYSPEREDPGNPKSGVDNIPKVIGGYTDECRKKACKLYSLAVKKLIQVSSCRVAEATKLMENIFRSVNIALVNELKMVYGAMDIDIWEVIAAAKTKPFGFMPFYPGPGLGGHCIPIDPFYLTWKAREYNQSTKFIELSGVINNSVTYYVIGKIVEALNEIGKPVNGSKILLVGLAYKPNVADDRESPTYKIMDELTNFKSVTSYYDPFIPIIQKTRSNMKYCGMKSIIWDRKVINSYDATVICTNHDIINYDELLNWSNIIIDTRNVYKEKKKSDRRIWSA